MGSGRSLGGSGPGCLTCVHRGGAGLSKPRLAANSTKATSMTTVDGILQCSASSESQSRHSSEPRIEITLRLPSAFFGPLFFGLAIVRLGVLRARVSEGEYKG